MDRETFDQWLERGIVVAVLAILVFGPLATGSVREQDFAVLLGLTVLALGLWVLRFWANPDHRLQWPPACWAVAAFVLYAIIRYSQAEVEYIARLELIRLLVYAAVFFIVLNNLHRQETTRVLFGVLLGLGTLVAIYAVYQFLADSRYVWHFPKPPQYRGRGSGTFICPNHLAGFLEMLVPIALSLVFISRTSAVKRVVYGYTALVMLAGIGVSVSRGGYLACGLALLVFFALLLRYRSYRRVAALALLILVVGAGLFITKARHPQKRLRLMFTQGQLEDASTRPLLWMPALRMWKDHPWFGVGPAHFDVRFPAYRPQAMQSRPLWAHNDYVNALADWGVVGSVIIGGFGVCVGLGVVRTWKYVQRSPSDFGMKPSDRSAYVLGAATGLLALLIHSAIDFNMHIPANAILAITILASLTSHLRFATDRYWVSPHLLGRLALTMVGGVGIWYLGGQVVPRYREGTLLLQAEQARSEREQLAALGRAYVVDPKNPETVAQLGEILRLRSWEGGSEWRQQAEGALKWFALGTQLNPYDCYCCLRSGMCLDWLGRFAEASACFQKAREVDPMSYYVALMSGWHELQLAEHNELPPIPTDATAMRRWHEARQDHYTKARDWLKRSIEIIDWANPLAYEYLGIVNERLAHETPIP